MAWNVIEQDRMILESQRGLRSRLREHRFQSDLGVVRFRRMLEEEAARQRAVYEGQVVARGPAVSTL